jgi:hypothetical protein
MFTEDGILMMLLVTVATAGNYELGDEGVIRIAEGLEKNTSLIRLYLAFARMFPPDVLLHPVVISH